MAAAATVTERTADRFDLAGDGDRDAPVDDWPTTTGLGGVTVTAVEPRGAPVELRVVDDGRTVTWDLREGRYADDAVSQAAAVLADAATVTEPAAAFTVTPAAGTPVPAFGQGVSTSSTQVDVDGAQVAFGVPARFRGGTFTFAPQATVRALTVVGGAADVSWTQRPPEVSFPLDLDG